MNPPTLFPISWFATGIVTPESASDFARYAQTSPNHPARHWLWAAFRDWSEERERLTSDECRTAYALGEADPDQNLGTAMMCHVLLQRTCPSDVRITAAQSNRPAVRKITGL
ncbi:hypothetical protein VT84_38345 [Gemmata sp. SH-PL17]|uniref:hypothetical protein n=1 Tax=Gemmata sp. SH-PL17 TaxID=1630693 RepID=UPI00078B6E36|nr:hypothetical protein [Gemmata sp. SH-PL17]AMV30316.1 hypothetical protein VT84_38345 [Gemmata sp. SH-PL17]